jgi:hypothetical protein
MLENISPSHSFAIGVKNVPPRALGPTTNVGGVNVDELCETLVIIMPPPSFHCILHQTIIVLLEKR